MYRVLDNQDAILKLACLRQRELKHLKYLNCKLYFTIYNCCRCTRVYNEFYLSVSSLLKMRMTENKSNK